MSDPVIAGDADALHLRDHDRLSRRLHAHGDGYPVRLLRVLPAGAGDPGQPRVRPVFDQHLQRDEQRRAGVDTAVSVHGLRDRARQCARSPVPQPAARRALDARFARGGDAPYVRAVRDRYRHRRRRCHADGPAGLPADAQGGLRHAPRIRGHLRRRLPRHSDPALDHAHRLRGGGERLGGAVVRRGHDPRAHSGRPLHGVRCRVRHAQARRRPSDSPAAPPIRTPGRRW